MSYDIYAYGWNKTSDTTCRIDITFFFFERIDITWIITIDEKNKHNEGLLYHNKLKAFIVHNNRN